MTTANPTGTPTTGTPTSGNPTTGTPTTGAQRNPGKAPRARPAIETNETKASYRTTEFFVYIASVVGVLIAAQLVGRDDGHLDYFRADRAWLYIVVLTVGYMISRGLAKAGSHDHGGFSDREFD